jgi:hypothetical protein
MDSIPKMIEALQRTPIPNLLIILGGVFLLLAFVGRIGGTIEMPPGRQKWAGLVGAVFLIAGIVASLPINLDLRRGDSNPSTKASEGIVKPPDATQPPAAGPTAQYPVTLASGVEVKVGPLIYRILAAQLDRSAAGKFSLLLRIRLTTQDQGALLHHNSFRLLVDGVPQAPEREPMLSEVVANNSAKEGMVRFVLPEAVTDVKLQIIGQGRYKDERPLIPINLQAAKP